MKKAKLIFIAFRLWLGSIILLLANSLLKHSLRSSVCSPYTVFIGRIYEKKLIKWSDKEKKYISLIIGLLPLCGHDDH